MNPWIVPIGFAIAYLGGSMSMLVYHDARQQGIKKLTGNIRSIVVSLVAALLYAAVVTLLLR